MRAMRNSGQENQQQIDPRKSSQSRIFKPTGQSEDQDKILEYGAQLNDIALQL